MTRKRQPLSRARGRIHSMTGFGRGIAEEDEFRFNVEVKGVNHRFLDAKLRLPPAFADLEPELRSRVRQHTARGRVDIVVSLTTTRRPPPRVEIRSDLAGEFLKAARALKKEFRLSGTVGVDRVMSFPGVVQITVADESFDGRGSAALIEAFEQALAEFDSIRGQEGDRLQVDLRQRLHEINSATARIESEGRDLAARYAARLQERITALTGERQLDDVRLAHEVALLADRLDITEEIVRLKGYLEQMETTLSEASGSVGKTLDFILQEMNREATTIASKSEALAVCQAALSIRGAVEQIREQVQNIE